MDLTIIRFGVGHHKPTETPTGDRDLCIMEAVSFVAGEPWSASPKCASPAIAAFLRRWNDSLSDGDRDRLLPAAVWVPRLVGSRGDESTEQRRAYLALDWMIRVHTPAWLDLVPSLVSHATALRALPEVVDLTTAQAAGDTLRAARAATLDATLNPTGSAARAAAEEAALDAAWGAAWDAARDAAWSAARDAAWSAARAAAEEAALDAAWDAARAAAGNAARNAAGDVLRPTVETLQQSALDLLDRMLACGQREATP